MQRRQLFADLALRWNDREAHQQHAQPQRHQAILSRELHTIRINEVAKLTGTSGRSGAFAIRSVERAGFFTNHPSEQIRRGPRTFKDDNILL